MDETNVKIGDRLFLYGQYLVYADPSDIDYHTYNSVMGYSTTGGYLVDVVKDPRSEASVPGFVTDFCLSPSLAPETPFPMESFGNKVHLIDVTEDMSRRAGELIGTKTWMPTTQQVS